MSREREDRIRDGYECSVKTAPFCYTYRPVLDRIQSSTHHTHNPSDENGQHTRDTQPTQPIQGPRKRTYQSRNSKDPRIQHETKLPVTQARQSDLASKQLTTGGKDGKDDRTKSQELSPHGSEEDVARITHIVDLGMVHFELYQEPRGVRGEDAEEDDDDEAGDDADDSERGMQGEHAIGDDFRDHQNGD